jgi:hypothetical protein
MADNAILHDWQTAPSTEAWHGPIPLGGSALQLAVGKNADGRLEIFYVGTNNYLFHNWQTAPNANVWFGETRFASDSAKQIAVGTNANGSLVIFYVGHGQ